MLGSTIMMLVIFSGTAWAQNNFYLADNGVTVKCENATPGSSGVVNINGVDKTFIAVADLRALFTMINREKAAYKACTSHITVMSNLYDMPILMDYEWNKISHWDVSNVTIMTNTFYETNVYEDLSYWDVSNVTDMRSMFEGAGVFNSDISRWDVRNVTDMSYMFSEARAFNQDISDWEVDNVTNMYAMFYNAVSFSQDLSYWCVKNIAPIADFNYGTAMTSADLPVWGTCPERRLRLADNRVTITYLGGTAEGQRLKLFGDYYTIVNNEIFQDSLAAGADLSLLVTSFVTDMSGLFKDLPEFNEDISSWDTRRVTDMGEMFSGASSFNRDIGYWDVGKVEDMNNMFKSATAFNQDIGNWDTGNVTNMFGMFWDATSFNQFIGDWDVGKVTSMSSMFRNAPLFNHDVGDWDVGNVSSMFQMFDGTEIYYHDLSGWCVENIGSEPASFMTGGPLTEPGNDIFTPIWGTCPPPKFKIADNGVTVIYTGQFLGKKFKLNGKRYTVVNEDMLRDAVMEGADLTVLNTSMVTDMDSLFTNNTDFNQDIGNWDVSNVTDMFYMFAMAQAFNQDIGYWDVGNVTNMSFMFATAQAFNQDISYWDVGNVTDMSYMFSGANRFNRDIGGWDVGKVTGMSNMFNAASDFNQDLSGWCVQNVSIYSNFNGAFIFKGKLDDWNYPLWGTCPVRHEVGSQPGWQMVSSPSTDTYKYFTNQIWTQGMEGGRYSDESAEPNVFTFEHGVDPSYCGGEEGGEEYCDGFVPLADLETTITPGSGFIAYLFESNDHETEGKFPKRLKINPENLNDEGDTFTPQLSLADDGWSLLGNPYDAPIYWDNITKNGMHSSVYVYEGLVEDKASYLEWNGAGGDLEGGVIGAFQGFWVQNNNQVQEHSLEITPSSRTKPGQNPEKARTQSGSFKILAEMDGMSDRIFFTFTADGALERDGRDALKLEPLDYHNHLSMSSTVGGEALSINNLPLDFEDEAEYPLSINALKMSENGYAPQSGKVTLRAADFKNLPENWGVFVNNYNTDERINLREAENYTFVLNPKQKAVATSAPMSAIVPASPTPTRAKIAEESGITISIIAGDTPTASEVMEKPAVFALEQNYPNPFNPATTIKYSLAKAGPVTLTLYNVMGQKIAELVNTTQTAGVHSVRWNAGTAASGMYFYRLKSGGQTLTKQMMLIK